ncbi:MAG: GH92 family glycosyl hydrolase [Cytophagales bacterium]|nr:GH92 family glycosyl hydrolase [Cytophagales bacterium]
MSSSKKRRNVLLTLALGAALCAGCSPNKEKKVLESRADLVNPLVGSDSEYKFSNGNTYPAIALPWGMNFWTPQTAKMRDGWTYAYKAKHIKGFKQTHQPSPWLNDYAAFSLMPLVGELKIDETERQSAFSHENETSSPHYYSVLLDDYKTKVEISPTKRCAIFRFTFPETQEAKVLLDGYWANSHIVIDKERQTISGWVDNNHGGVADNFKNYFVARFDRPFEKGNTWLNAKATSSSESKGEKAGAYVAFNAKSNQEVVVRVASSFVSLEQAKLNLERELGQSSFEEIKTKAKEAWNSELGKVQIVKGNHNQEDQKVFYSNLYRLLLFPREFYEVSAANDTIHYSPYNGKIEKGVMYTDNGFWDTFRAVYPFYSLLYPAKYGEMMQGIMVNPFKESGWLPEWSSPGHRNVMIGSNSASIIAEAYCKGIRNFDIETAYQGILKNSENAGPLTSVGRAGVEWYNKLGYIPCDAKVNEYVARTLEYAYNDFSIYRLAVLLNRPKEEIERFAKRAQNYRNVFDASTNFMRGKDSKGNWQKPFVPDAWGGAFTEGSAWHYTWSVLHDPQGLIDLMGGREAFTAKLDSVFTTPPTFDYSYYNQEIHEMTEMAAANMGQYAHGNQPIQHGIYLYNYARQPWKTQYWTDRVMDSLYSAKADGYCGDEDNGQTSAWYVFSAMGFYPVAGVTGEYVIGAPRFEHLKITLPTGNVLEIKAKNLTERNIYIQSLKVNGKPYGKNYFTHELLKKGGLVEFEMGPEPNKSWGSRKEDIPFSMSNNLKI